MELLGVTKSNHLIFYNNLHRRHQLYLDENKEFETTLHDDKYWKERRITELVEKYVVRSKPFYHKNGLEDKSFVDEVLKIIKKGDDGKIYYMQWFHDGIDCLDREWDDGNWVEVPKYLF